MVPQHLRETDAALDDAGAWGDGQALREMEDAEPAQEHRVRLDNGSPMEAQWRPNGSFNGSPMEAGNTQCFRWCGKDREV